MAGNEKKLNKMFLIFAKLVILVLNRNWFAQSEFVASSYDLVDFIKSNNDRLSTCPAIFNTWIYENRFQSERTNFFLYEKSFQAFCNNHKPYFLSGNFDFPNGCSSLTLCNATYCLTYAREATKLIYAVPTTCLKKESPSIFDYPGLTSNQRKFEMQSVFSFYGLRSISENTHKKFQLSFMKNEIQFHSSFGDGIDDFFMRDCKHKGSINLFYEGEGELPNECEELYFCDSKLCNIIPLTGNAYAYVFRRHEDPSVTNLNLPGKCEVVHSISRGKRRVWKNPEDLDENADRAKVLKSDQSFGILRFNLPGGYLYCGPGTNVEEMDDQGGPVNELDQICRAHDVDYMIGTPSEEADEKLLKALWDSNSPLLPLFVSVFEAKRYFEIMFGQTYTSSLYYFPESHKSLLFSLKEMSAYDNIDPASPDYSRGMELEKRWKNILFNVWQGYCYAQEFPEITQMVREKQKFSAQPSPETPGTSQSKPSQSTQSGAEPQKDLPTSEGVSFNDDDKDEYPLIPKYYGRCRLVISEISTKFGDIPNFIELQRLCPPKIDRLASVSLRGYHLLVIKIGDPSEIIVNQDLSQMRLRLKTEIHPGTRRPRTNLYFVIGTSNSEPDLDIEQIPEFVTPSDGIKGIPADDQATYAIVLLYFSNENERVPAETSFTLQHRESFYVPKPIRDVQRSYIDKFIQDVAIYGAPCQLDICGDLVRLIPSPSPSMEPVGEQFVPIPLVQRNNDASFLSMNRCTLSSLPMQIDSFAEGPASPGRSNICPASPTPGLFTFRRSRLQSSAQKVIINVHHHFEEVAAGRRLTHGTSLEMTSEACSLGKDTIRKVLESWKSGTIETPGKKRKMAPHKQIQIDSFYAAMIKRIIQDFYAKNRAPYVDDIFKEFKEGVLVQEQKRREAGEQLTPFTCHEKTFRKILRRLGFKYGRIMTRDVLLMRPQIVMWRDKYLNILKKNRRSANPKKVIYLDETWIDPHARTSKGWVPAHCTNYRERAKYTYKKHKVGRGPRVIILNAGGEDGLVEGAMEVFAVHKKDDTGDYHDNINSEAYIKWFKKLLELLNATGEKYLIVQDNAPYHGASDAPNVRSTMQVMYDWLADNLPLIDRMALLPIEEYRRHHLWEMVKEQKAKNNFFIVDRLAQLDGHEVVRLPPYNCDLSPIEEVWNDVKYTVKKENVDQNVKTIIETAKRVMLTYPVAKWQAHVKHIRELEERYWKADGCFEKYYADNNRVIIPIDDNDDNEDDDDDDECLADNVSISSVHDDIIQDDADDDELLDI